MVGDDESGATDASSPSSSSGAVVKLDYELYLVYELLEVVCCVVCYYYWLPELLSGELGDAFISWV